MLQSVWLTEIWLTGFSWLQTADVSPWLWLPSTILAVIVFVLGRRLLAVRGERDRLEGKLAAESNRANRLENENRQLEKSAWKAEARASAAEETLEALKQEQPEADCGWLESVYASDFMGIAHLDKAGRIIEANQGLRVILELEAEALDGLLFTDLVLEEDRHFLADLPDPLTEVHYFEVRLCSGEHRECWCKISVSGIAADFRSEASLLVMIEDIQDRKELALALEKRARELARSNKELEQFALIASHDLNEPLNKIVAFGRLLEDECRDRVSKEGEEYLGYMISAAGRMQNLITSLFQLAQVTVKTHPFQPVDMNALVEDVLADFRFRIEETEAKITVDPLPVVYGDAVQLTQLVQNLVGNALKFHFPDTPPVVHISSRQEVMIDDPAYPGRKRRMCRLSVKDQGIGFDSLNDERLFNAFQRLHPKGHYEGAGIGLAICRKIVERHDGYIFARSKPGSGAEFRVVLPVSQSADEPADE
ncbi:MAG: ATP-binding protein [Acidobacteriota bacterium]|nr:ATP-binding protein [Acidobacteriota bacterium]